MYSSVLNVSIGLSAIMEHCTGLYYIDLCGSMSITNEIFSDLQRMIDVHWKHLKLIYLWEVSVTHEVDTDLWGVHTQAKE